MKIGLIGINKYAPYLNFACQLHVYAFQRLLDAHGYDSTILDYQPVDHKGFNMRNPAPGAEKKYRDAVLAKRSGNALKKLADLAVGFRSVTEERGRRYDKFAAFEKENLRFTAEVYDPDLLEVQDPGFDCYICVTDVIWKIQPTGSFDRGFLLGSKAFEGKSKIAYAASRGTYSSYTPDQLALFRHYLSDIDAVSVRERDFQDYIEENTDSDVTTVVDPVLFHDQDFWHRVAAAPPMENYLVLYYVMEKAEDTIQKAVEYAKLHDLTIVELSDRPAKYGRVTDPDVKHIARYDVSMEEWLGYIEHAEAVFTNSFHGCCFSLIFETPLFVGRRNGQKVPNFLATFSLSERKFEPDVDVATLSAKVDYAQAGPTLERLRGDSKVFLFGALEEARRKVESTPKDDRSPRYEQWRRSLTYPIHFQSGERTKAVLRPEDRARLQTKRVSRGAIEYFTPGLRFTNDGSSAIPPNLFLVDGYEHVGWTLRFRIDNRWFWYLDDGRISCVDPSDPGFEAKKAVLLVGDGLPHLPANHIAVAVLVSQWRKLPEQGAGAVAGRALLPRLRGLARRRLG